MCRAILRINSGGTLLPMRSQISARVPEKQNDIGYDAALLCSFLDGRRKRPLSFTRTSAALPFRISVLLKVGAGLLGWIT